ncbi:MAG: Type 1 glutamine amidotransferase-like domain-containing protein [Desulfobacterales bacterium]
MLALTGSGEYLPAMESVDMTLIRRLKAPPRVVCLPTAAGQEGPERIGYWSQLGVDHFARLGAKVEALPVIDRASANEKDLADRISDANFVYLSGGKPGYLYQTLRGSLAWKAILSVLSRGGLLAGCSAGAMILGESFFGPPGQMPGFKLIPGATVLPHFDQIPESRVESFYESTGEDLTLLGIEGDTTLVQSKDRYEVMGTGGVTVWNGSGRARFTRGMIPVDVLGPSETGSSF